MATLLRVSVSFIAFIWSCTFIQAQTASQKNVVQILDFHSTHRCMTCNAIEKNSREVLNKHFKKEIDAGKIAFQTVNVDATENLRLAEAFEASGTALFINILKDGKSEKIDLTQFAFMNVNKDGDAFEKGLVEAVKKALLKLG